MAETEPTPTPEPEPTPAPEPSPEPAPEPAPEPTTEPAPEPEPQAFAWPENWREKIAETMGDDKEQKAALGTLKRMADPSQLASSYRELQKVMSSGGMIKLPKADATDEDRMAYYKQIGAPEEAEKLLENLNLGDGMVLGDLDRGPAEEFVKAVHGSVTPQEFTDKAIN